MIGRAAQGRPWIFSEVNSRLDARAHFAAPVALAEVRVIIRAHLESLYDFYGDDTGVRVARKHFGWYCRQHPGTESLRGEFVAAVTASAQLALVEGMAVSRAA
jgi:tRNA-dihydrouridine synthase B